MARLLAVLALLASPLRAAEVTVYNSNLGLVKDVRPFNLKSGVNRLEVTDVAAHIDPTSVHFKSLTAPDAVSVLEQDFQYDLVSQDKLLQRYLGQEVELVRYGLDGSRKDALKGVLLSNQGGRVLKVGERIHVNPGGEFILPDLPEGLLTKPTLVWQLKSSKGGEHQGEISYLTGGMSWSADYVLVVDKDDAKGDLNAWVTVANNSGATFKDAKLKLVAGDVHRAPAASPRGRVNYMAKMAMAAEMDGGMTEKSFFEYHLYTLGRPTTLANNSSKQVEMASAAGIPVKKLFIYDGVEGVQWTDFYGEAYSDPGYGLASGKKVSVFFELQNKKAEGLGIPLPKGRVRVYKKDDDGSLQLAGEDAIDHTPKDEKVRVKMGEAFDVVGERKRTNFQSGKRWLEETFEVRVRNHKETDAVVTVVEHLYRWSGWKVSDASHKWEKKDAQTIEFPVTVKKDGEAVITYTVKYSW